MIAVGVARPRAHGQAMISTETKLTSAIVNRTSGGAATNQTTNVAIAMQITTGVKMPLIDVGQTRDRALSSPARPAPA